MMFSKTNLAAAMAGDPTQGEALRPIVRKCAASGARRAHVQDQHEDIAQELWLFLLKNWERLDERYNIEPYLIQTAANIALNYHRKFSGFGTDADHRVDKQVEDDWTEAVERKEAGDTLVSNLDASRAAVYLAQHSAAFRAALNE